MGESGKEPQLGVPKRVITYVLEGLVTQKNPEKPVITVSSTTSSTDKLPRGQSTVARHAVRVLAEGTSDLFYSSLRNLNQARARTREMLSDKGYTVYTGGPRRIYVIEFEASWKSLDADTWLYVGETGLLVEHRIHQHFTGKRAARDWKHLSRRRPDLEPKAEYWSVEDSTRAEEAWGRFLSAQGYKIRGPKGFKFRSGLPSASDE